jgi:hypothetical protein
VGRFRYDFSLLVWDPVTGWEHVSKAVALRRPQAALSISLADLRVDLSVAQTSLTELLLFEFPRNQRMRFLPVQIAYWLNLSRNGTGYEAGEAIWAFSMEDKPPRFRSKMRALFAIAGGAALAARLASMSGSISGGSWRWATALAANINQTDVRNLNLNMVASIH